MLNIGMLFNFLENISNNLQIGDFLGIGKWLLQVLIIVSMWLLNQVRSLIQLIFDIAEINFFGDDTIGEFAQRIYIVLGVLMLFKITISCIQYLVSPEKMDDKQNGFGGILMRTLGAVLLLVFSPTLFTFAKTAQTAIVKTLPAVILGGSANSFDAGSVADDIAFSTALGFLTYSNEECNDGSISGIPYTGSGSSQSEVKFSSVNDIINGAEEIVDNKNCGTIWNGRTNRYTFNYLCLPVGIFLIFILISMLIDVGIRTIKFSFLELIAPIPIASYIDPKSSKKSFDSWVHNCLTVYADLFIRLAVIYFVLFVFDKTINGVLATEEMLEKFTLGRLLLIKAVLIVALFMFAKSAPKFICDVLGIKGDGNIGDMFKRASGLAGAGFAGIRAARSNAVSQYRRLKSQDKTKSAAVAGALRSAAAGFGSATARGLKAATWDKKGFNEVRKSSSRAAVAARDARNDRVDNLYTDGRAWHSNAERAAGAYGWREYRRDKREASLGIPSTPGYTKLVYDVMDSVAQSAGAEKSFGATKMNERPNTFTVNKGGIDYTIASARSYASIQVGTENVHKPDGTIGTWTVTDQANALAIQQDVEKRTSYLVTADLIQHSDPTAIMNHQKTMLAIKNNETMFNDSSIMKEITAAFRKKGLIGPTDEMNFEKLTTMADESNLATLTIEQCADVIEAIKSSFEAIRTNQYAKAQADDARAKKTQQAINNDKKS